MSAQGRFRQVDVQRALKAAKACGFEEVRVSIGIDGKLDIIVGRAANDASETVELK